MAILKIWRSPIFEKHIFPTENARNMPENPVFGIFRDFFISFFYFFARRCVLAMPMTWPSSIFEKNLFPAEYAGNMPEIAVLADFHRTSFLYFVVFLHKNFIYSNTHHQAWFSSQQNWFLKPKLSKYCIDILHIHEYP